MYAVNERTRPLGGVELVQPHDDLKHVEYANAVRVGCIRFIFDVYLPCPPLRPTGHTRWMRGNAGRVRNISAPRRA